MNKKLLAVLMSSAFLLTACGGDDDSSVFDDGIPKNNIVNPVVATPTAYTLTDMSASAADSVVMTYKMLGVNGKEVQATSLVFTPKTPVPKDGWPIVIWAHGTTGVADICAPSRLALGSDVKNMISKFLAEGYVVVAPDYEGLGSAGDHPFLNVKSEAYSITDAVVAARNWLGTKASKQWVTVGHSQGGQAALGAAQYASRAQLNYKGTVAVAPASNLKTIFDFGTEYAKILSPAEKIGIYASLNTYGALIVAGMQNQPNPATYAQVFQTEAEITATDASRLCATPLGVEFATEMGQVYPSNPTLFGYLTQTNFMQVPTVSTFINKTAQPLTVKVTTPIKIYQGQLDTTVPIVATTQLIQSAKALGTKITEVEGPWSHSSAMNDNVDNIVTDVNEMFVAQ